MKLTEEQQRWAEALDRRVDNLTKLVKLRAPGLVIAHAALLFNEALIGRYPDEWGDALKAVMQRAVRAADLCAFCGKPLRRHNSGICGACHAEILKEAADPGDMPDEDLDN